MLFLIQARRPGQWERSSKPSNGPSRFHHRVDERM